MLTRFYQNNLSTVATDIEVNSNPFSGFLPGQSLFKFLVEAKL